MDYNKREEAFCENFSVLMAAFGKTSIRLSTAIGKTEGRKFGGYVQRIYS